MREALSQDYNLLPHVCMSLPFLHSSHPDTVPEHLGQSGLVLCRPKRGNHLRPLHPVVHPVHPVFLCLLVSPSVQGVQVCRSDCAACCVCSLRASCCNLVSPSVQGVQVGRSDCAACCVCSHRASCCNLVSPSVQGVQVGRSDCAACCVCSLRAS